MTRGTKASYQKGLQRLLLAHSILSEVKTTNWTQAVVLNAVYTALEEAIEALADVSIPDLPPQSKRTIRSWTD